MANYGGKRSSAPGNNSSLILGILIGMVLGLTVAGGVAWYISKRPNTFLNKEQHETTTAVPAVPGTATPKPAVPAVQPPPSPAASGVGETKPRFEFYKILTGKEGATPKNSGHPAVSPTAPKVTARPSPQNASYFLQAGSFSTAEDADKLKAKLALLGMEASVQTADVPGKGMYYRVRLGPFHNAEELGSANNTLKQNGINDTAQVRAQ